MVHRPSWLPVAPLYGGQQVCVPVPRLPLQSCSNREVQHHHTSYGLCTPSVRCSMPRRWAAPPEDRCPLVGGLGGAMEGGVWGGHAPKAKRWFITGSP